MPSFKLIAVMGSLTVSTLLILANGQILSKINNPLKDKSFSEQVEIADQALDIIESETEKVAGFVVKYSEVIKGTCGGLILLYGSLFPNTMLLIQAVGAAGLPQLRNHLSELGLAYKRTRTVLKKEMPEIIKAKG